MNNQPKKFAVIVSSFNAEVTDKLLQGALTRFSELDIKEQNVAVFRVPGAVEIPLIAKLLAQSKKYDAIICLGAVIQGETNHYDYVCDQVSAGCQYVMLEYTIPVIFGVLTTRDTEQAMERAGGRHGNKGMESVDAAMTMVQLTGSLAAQLA